MGRHATRVAARYLRADRVASRYREAKAADWLQWIVQPADVIWKHHKEFVYGPVDDAMDAIISELAPKLVHAIGEVEVDEDVDEFLDGALNGKWDADKGNFSDCPNMGEDYCEGYEWGFSHADQVSKSGLPPAVKRKVVEEALKDFRSRVTEEVVERLMHKAWSAVSPAHTLKAIMHAVKKHGWKLGIGFAMFEIVEHMVLPAVLIALTGHEELAITGTIPIGEVIYAIIFRIMGRVPNEADKADPDGHLDWYEAKYGPVRIASPSMAERIAQRQVKGRWYEISISALAKGVQTWVRELERQGFTTDIEVFKTGPGGNQYYGPSTVTLEIEKEYTDEDGEKDTYYWSMKFQAGGYGGLDERDIGGGEGWRAMKAEAAKRLYKEMASYGVGTDRTAGAVKDYLFTIAETLGVDDVFAPDFTAFLEWLAEQPGYTISKTRRPAWLHKQYGVWRSARKVKRGAAVPVFDRLDKKQVRIPAALLEQLAEQVV